MFWALRDQLKAKLGPNIIKEILILNDQLIKAAKGENEVKFLNSILNCK